MLNKCKLAISPIGWTNDDDPSLGGHISFEQCISEMRQAGFEGTELGSKYPKDAKDLKQRLASQGLSLSSAWFSAFFTNPYQYQQTLDAFFDKASFLKNVGATIINVCEVNDSIQQKDLPLFGHHKPTFNDDQWQRLYDGLQAMGRIATEMGMQLAYHFHLGTGVQNQDEVDRLMANTSPELVGLLLDTGHAYAAGVDIHALISQYGARIRLLHLKDVRPDILQQAIEQKWSFMTAVKQGMFTVPGDGCIDFKPILLQMHHVHYQGWIVVEAEQDPAKAEPLLYAQKAKHYLSDIRG
jgi:inosose dehydratase